MFYKILIHWNENVHMSFEQRESKIFKDLFFTISVKWWDGLREGSQASVFWIFSAVSDQHFFIRKQVILG